MTVAGSQAGVLRASESVLLISSARLGCVGLHRTAAGSQSYLVSSIEVYVVASQAFAEPKKKQYVMSRGERQPHESVRGDPKAACSCA